MEELLKLIDKATVVSFDIFDTLIVRLYRKPTDLFLHLENSFCVSGFKKARTDSEQKARDVAFAHNIHEITLDEIYDQMHSSYRDLKEKEIQLEKTMCKADPEMLKVFQYAIDMGKTVYISSDMYLPQDVIEDILHKNGYDGYKKLYLSSVTKRPKVTGEMYEDIIRAAQVRSDEIIHIGDNKYTDVEIARKNGLVAFQYEPIKTKYGDILNPAYYALLNDLASNNVAASIAEGMITLDRAKNDGNSYWDNFAYKYAGIIMIGYCQWLKCQFDKEGIKKALFMLRDGYIVKRIFDLMYPEIETNEIYGSRRMFLFARMKKYEDIQEYITALSEGVSYRALYTRLCLDDPILYQRYCAAFPHQDEVASDRKAIHDFMKKNEDHLLKIGEKECKLYAKYLKTIYVPGERCAIVDLGWRCSMLKGVESICKSEKIDNCFYGYYLGTHPFKADALRVDSFGIKQGYPMDDDSILSSMNHLYCIDILELIFSAPHPSVLKLTDIDGTIVPVYQSQSQHESERNSINEQILKGCTRFVEDFLLFSREYPVDISAETALSPLYYFQHHISRIDELKLSSVFVFPGIGDDDTCFPLSKNGRGRIGLINPWPNVLGAESEALLRIQACAKSVGVDIVIIDNQGFKLDRDQVPTGDRYNESNLDFIISFNYETPKLIDCFYYYALWSPPEMALRLDSYVSRLSNNLIMNDDYLAYCDGPMVSHIKSVCMDKPRNLEHMSSLTPSFPFSALMEPTLAEPKLFYCGMNWEKVDGQPPRHNKLFKLLDETDKVEFYGPKAVNGWGNVIPWDGYKCYKGSLPFDGFSILKKINSCGVCLVLSSDIHRRSKAATNRVYEACAAGALMISDNNEFMLNYFGDSALFIDYNVNDERDTFNQIMEHYQWVIDHREEAVKMVKRAQSTYLKYFSAETQINNIVKHHSERRMQIARDLYAKCISKRVLVIYVLNTQYTEHIDLYLECIFRNITNQIYPNIQLGIAVDKSVEQYVKHYSETKCANVKVIPLDLFDTKNAKIMTDGQAMLHVQRACSFDYFILANAKERWFQDHITTLVRTLEDEGCICAYSGSLCEGPEGIRSPSFFERINERNLYDLMGNSAVFPTPGQFLFRAEACDLVPDYIFDCVDGKEHYAYANIIYYKRKKDIAFSHRMSFAFCTDWRDPRNIVISDDKQVRFIQELVKNDLPDFSAGHETVSAEAVQAPPAISAVAYTGPHELQKMFIIAPIRLLLKIRYYQAKMRKMPKDSKKYEKYEKEYVELLREYNRFWNP